MEWDDVVDDIEPDVPLLARTLRILGGGRSGVIEESVR